MATEENLPSVPQNRVSLTDEKLYQEIEEQKFKMDVLQKRLEEVMTSFDKIDKLASAEADTSNGRIRIATVLLAYLRSKAKTMANPDLASLTCGIKHVCGVGLVDRNGTPLSNWSKNEDLSLLDGSGEGTGIDLSGICSSDQLEASYMVELQNSVKIVSLVMEVLVKRAIMAESAASKEKERATLGQEEIKRKAAQIENMSSRLEDMENFAIGTKNILDEVRMRVEELVEETSRQRRQAVENEEELSRVKHDFESLKSFVSSLISVRETLLSSERQFQTIEILFERLTAKATTMENEKMQKEAEVRKLMEENVRLSALLDKKEAQLLAMNEQCKLMALNT
ncbi:hypothetical protein MLD38_029584 [Melastoma candidum]|uniref:Uncharacterized protein n=1 Tax=Melastoma candidum TaxID=119954 RepID=A0ACB9N4E2_9MYRT|nr:hypothetical protein MLD38_029584 [Melastoma candidum]